MNSVLEIVSVMCAAALVGAIFGWHVAHTELAAECERQGSFYVGKKDFECKVKP